MVQGCGFLLHLRKIDIGVCRFCLRAGFSMCDKKKVRKTQLLLLPSPCF